MSRHTTNPLPLTETARRTEALRAAALSAGFDSFGVCRAEILQPERQHFLRWLDDGKAGKMGWMTRDWVLKASDPKTAMADARSVVCLGLSYSGHPRLNTTTGAGTMARYSNGLDYHRLIGSMLDELTPAIAGFGGKSRAFVDTSPVMEKALAVRAGLGWQGRNTNLISTELGSFVFLGGLVTDLELEISSPTHEGCGTCRLCVVACPTGALGDDYTIDARLCISYLTIEHRGAIPRELRRLMGTWVFGCDICQDVCPPVGRVQDRAHPTMKRSRVSHVRALATQSLGKREATDE